MGVLLVRGVDEEGRSARSTQPAVWRCRIQGYELALSDELLATFTMAERKGTRAESRRRELREEEARPLLSLLAVALVAGTRLNTVLRSLPSSCHEALLHLGSCGARAGDSWSSRHARHR